MIHSPDHSADTKPLLRYEPARAHDYGRFLWWTRDETAGYLGPTLELMQMTWPEFEALFRRVGQVYGVFEGGQAAGFYWIEERGAVLHIHGLILRESFRGRGIGTEVLKMLEDRHRGEMDAIELGVHESNVRAHALYERLGYVSVKKLDDLGFYVMQKRLKNGSTHSQ
jgi:RimJ/RimL family protein N-acetyltransferase